MIGTDLNLQIPSLSDTYAQMVAKTAAGLQAIEDSLADKATPAALNINAPLDFGGNAVINCTSVQLADGNTPGVAGSLFYHLGEFYAVDSTGIVQITANGQINAAGIGGIGGDYGGVNPAAVTYDNASSQYRFYSNGGTGAWADLAARSVILEGTNGTVQLKVDDAINVSRILSVKSLPGSGVKLLVYNAATSTLEDASVTNPDGLTVDGNISATGTGTFTTSVTSAAYHVTAAQTHIVSPHLAIEAGGYTHTRTAFGITLDNTTNSVVYPVVLPVGAIIAGFKLFVDKASPSGYLHAQMQKYNGATGALTNVGGGVSSGTPNGFVTMSDVTATGTIATNEHWFVTLTVSFIGYSDQLLQLEVTYTY